MQEHCNATIKPVSFISVDLTACVVPWMGNEEADFSKAWKLIGVTFLLGTTFKTNGEGKIDYNFQLHMKVERRCNAS